jgi:antirestriction protein ArdC
VVPPVATTEIFGSRSVNLCQEESFNELVVYGEELLHHLTKTTGRGLLYKKDLLKEMEYGVNFTPVM